MENASSSILSFTGVEALFADLGAFSRRAIQLSWLCYAFPCLLLAYIGQAAYIANHPGAYENPFFNAVPPGMLYPSLIIAILAAIVASQAIITATFQVRARVVDRTWSFKFQCSKVKVGQLKYFLRKLLQEHSKFYDSPSRRVSKSYLHSRLMYDLELGYWKTVLLI